MFMKKFIFFSEIWTGFLSMWPLEFIPALVWCCVLPVSAPSGSFLISAHGSENGVVSVFSLPLPHPVNVCSSVSAVLLRSGVSKPIGWVSEFQSGVFFLWTLLAKFSVLVFCLFNCHIFMKNLLSFWYPYSQIIFFIYDSKSLLGSTLVFSSVESLICIKWFI